jgi:low affinity Fe/Cu permease
MHPYTKKINELIRQVNQLEARVKALEEIKKKSLRKTLDGLVEAPSWQDQPLPFKSDP